ncbi:MAG: hypothetical protein KIS66_09285 [Fimbriimonadaceae bacterium]|nr:hypothetical protein [Fimbriimonadaceae bacterium]
MRSIAFLPLLVVSALCLTGCAGESGKAFRFAGVYSGTWVQVGDPTDAGTSNWTVRWDGQVEGTDLDPGRGTTFAVAGKISEGGDLVTVSTPSDGSGAAGLTGRMAFDADGKLTGILTWQVTPPLQYRYTFTRTAR